MIPKAFDFIGSLPDGELEVSVSKGNLVIKTGKIKNQFKTLGAELFAYTKSIDTDKEPAKIPALKLKKAIDHVIYAVAVSGSNQQMLGMYLECMDGKLNFVGLDGHRIAWDCIDYEGEFQIIVPRAAIAMKKYCDENCITYFTTYAKKNVTSSMGGKVLANEWIDTIRFRDWLKNDMQERVFNLLVLNTKVPFTDEGITAVEGKMEESLKVGQKVGGIAPTEYDDDDNEIPGYTITVPSSSSMSDSEKASRQLTGCKFTAKLAGAIQVVNISGNLVYA